ncbi:hypothetical protein [Halorubrum ezzemoulense]|uniref:hypothetical protein n=1 Tax=Halorubrum ezzemoulense TaxID=337243 RepID=UPI001C90B531|nr:hypothetical protein [Halorubrum ezzemoulense]
MALVDNNILSSLAKIDRLDLLPSVFETVETPPSVIDELDRAEVDGYNFVSRIDAVKSYNDGWLEIAAPTRAELKLADDIVDHALSSTDARCLAIASQRDARLVTDDAHVGTRGKQLDVEVWDLVLLLRRIEEKASRFSAGMNPTLPFTVHRSMARLDIPRCSNTHIQVILST